jgi:DnaJ-class molecular chaperone
MKKLVSIMEHLGRIGTKLHLIICSVCGGTGKINGVDCTACGGKGSLPG